MTDELITVRGVVRALEGGDALVEVEQGGCGRCHEEGGCGGQQLTQMFCSGPKSYRAENTIGAGIGDHVVVATQPGSVRRTANLAYGVPLMGAIGGALIGAPIGGDPGAVVGATFGLIAALGYVRFRSRLDAGGVRSRPYLVSHS